MNSNVNIPCPSCGLMLTFEIEGHVKEAEEFVKAPKSELRVRRLIFGPLRCYSCDDNYFVALIRDDTSEKIYASAHKIVAVIDHGKC